MTKQKKIGKNKTKINDADWEQLAELKYDVDNSETIECNIENVNINKDYSSIVLSPIKYDLMKEISLESRLNSGEKSTFEKFLISNGISPTENNIEEKLKNSSINISGHMQNNDFIVDLNHIKNNKSNNYINRYEESKKYISNHKNQCVGLFLAVILFISPYVIYQIYGISALINGITSIIMLSIMMVLLYITSGPM